MGVRATMYGSQKSHYPCLKIDNDHIFRNDYTIKTTQPISMILVQYHSFQKTMFDLMKLKYMYIHVCYILEYQSNENRAFRIFWDTRYSTHIHKAHPNKQNHNEEKYCK